ncbi:MAG: MFS transporter [Dehalococcoidia bacterium]
MTTAAPARANRLPRTFDSFRDREFRWFYLAMLGQMASMNMQMVVRGYLAYVLTGSYAALGLIALAGAAPMLGLSVFGGVMADRMPKRTVLQIGQALSLVNAAVLAVLSFTGLMRIEWLLLSALAQGAVMALTMPSRQSMIPDIVGMDRMMNAVSLNMAGMNSMRLFAPALGGFIIATAGFGWAFATMGALYGVALVTLAKVTWQPAISPGKAGQSVGQVGRSAVADIVEGVRYIARTRVMAALLSLSFISSIFGMPYQFLLPGYVADIFDGGGTEVGLLMSISAVGSLAGALVLASMPNRKRGWMLLGGTMVLAGGLVLFTQTSNYWIAAAFIVPVGIGSSFRQALSQGLLHANVENEYRGRVMSVFMMQMSVMQLSTFFVGVAAEFLGIRMALAGLAVGLALSTAAFAVFVPSVRKLD